jgi:SnoaL-like domain
MAARKTANELDFEALRYAIERSDPDLVLGFYAEDAELSIVNGTFPQNSPFDLCGKAEISKHLKVVFSQKTSHRVEQEVVSEDRVMFREACEYPDGSRVVVATTLELRGGKIVRQEDVVATDVRADRKEEITQKAPLPETQHAQPPLSG